MYTKRGISGLGPQHNNMYYKKLSLFFFFNDLIIPKVYGLQYCIFTSA